MYYTISYLIYTKQNNYISIYIKIHLDNNVKTYYLKVNS